MTRKEMFEATERLIEQWIFGVEIEFSGITRKNSALTTSSIGYATRRREETTGKYRYVLNGERIDWSFHDLRHPYVKLKLKFLLTQHYRCIGAKVLDFPLNFKPVVGVNIHLVYKHICECLCQGVFLFHCFCCLQSF